MEQFKQSNPQEKVSKKAAIVFLISMFTLVYLIVKCSSDNESPSAKITYDELDALTHAQIYIKNKLKSPSSAEFEYGLDGVTKVNDTVFIVVGTVDSQNSFGAMLRSNYSCKVIFHPKADTHDIVDAIIE